MNERARSYRDRARSRRTQASGKESGSRSAMRMRRRQRAGAVPHSPLRGPFGQVEVARSTRHGRDGEHAREREERWSSDARPPAASAPASCSAQGSQLSPLWTGPTSLRVASPVEMGRSTYPEAASFVAGYVAGPEHDFAGGDAKPHSVLGHDRLRGRSLCSIERQGQEALRTPSRKTDS